MKLIASLLIALLFIGCTPSEINRSIQIVTHQNPIEAAEQYGMQKAIHYAINPKEFKRDIQRFHSLIKLFKGDIRKKWGKRERKVPSKTRFVKYLRNYDSRVLIDFNKGKMTVETLKENNLEPVTVTALLTPEDPRNIEIYSAKEMKEGGTPFLLGEVVDNRGKTVTNRKQAQHFARYLKQHQHQTRQIKVKGVRKTLHYLNIPLVRNHQSVRANHYSRLMKKYAWKYRVNPQLVYAITKVESNFNPYAVSPTGAYGLMQLIPTTGGRDAFRKVYGYDAIPSPRFLFQPEKNIALGTAYIAILQQNYLRKITNPVSREYCSIAAYNAGAGTILRHFNKRKSVAFKLINRMKPAAVYYALHKKLNRSETRRYISKVLTAKRKAPSQL